METGSDNFSPDLSEAWRKRFEFFSQHGRPTGKDASAALGRRSYRDRATILFNPWGFIFGIIYFVVLGIPKRGIGLGAVGLLLSILSGELTGHYDSRLVAFTMQVLYAMTANYYRYIKVTEGRDEWNPLRDLVTDEALA
jgi:hypothetical protein